MRTAKSVLLHAVLLTSFAVTSIAAAQELDLSCDAQYFNYGTGESISNSCTDGAYVNVAYDFWSGSVYYDGTYGGGYVPVNPEGPPTHVQGVQPIFDGEISAPSAPDPTLGTAPGALDGPVSALAQVGQKGGGDAKLSPPIWIGVATAALCHANQQAVIAQLTAHCIRLQELRRPGQVPRGPSSISAGWVCGWGASAKCP